MSEPTYTPDRLRSLAAKAYRFGASFNVVDLREVGDYLARSALAADEQGDILQQHAAAREELGRLSTAVAEADASRIERDRARAERDEARAERDKWKRMALGAGRDRDALRSELDGQRLWYHLALEFVAELRPTIPADKQKLIDPMRSAAIAQDHRALIAKLVPQLHRIKAWASLYAQTASEPRATSDVADADELLDSDACSQFLPRKK